MDERNPAAPKKPWNDDFLVHTNKQWFPHVFQVMQDFVHPQHDPTHPIEEPRGILSKLRFVRLARASFHEWGLRAPRCQRQNEKGRRAKSHLALVICSFLVCPPNPPPKRKTYTKKQLETTKKSPLQRTTINNKESGEGTWFPCRIESAWPLEPFSVARATPPVRAAS